jgi:hypothetical protein
MNLIKRLFTRKKKTRPFTGKWPELKTASSSNSISRFRPAVNKTYDETDLVAVILLTAICTANYCASQKPSSNTQVHSKRPNRYERKALRKMLIQNNSRAL